MTDCRERDVRREGEVRQGRAPMVTYGDIRRISPDRRLCAMPEPSGVHLGGASAGRESARQRRLSGFARGYLLRKYGVLRSRWGLRALLVEAIVTGARLVLRRDAVSLVGRWEGWRRGALAQRVTLPLDAVDSSIDLRLSLRMRGEGYWAARD